MPSSATTEIYTLSLHDALPISKTVAKEGAAHGVRANVICPGFVRTPLVEKQIPEQSRTLGLSEEDVVKKVMLKDTVDGEFTTLERSEEHTSELQSHSDLVCRLLRPPRSTLFPYTTLFRSRRRWRKRVLLTACARTSSVRASCARRLSKSRSRSSRARSACRRKTW